VLCAVIATARKNDHRWIESCIQTKSYEGLEVQWAGRRTNFFFFRLHGPFEIVTTYFLTPWCRVLLEKLTGLQLVKKFPAFHGTQKFITALTSVRHLSLTWASPVHSIYEGEPKNNENFFSGGVRDGTFVCSRLVRVRDCLPHQLAKRRPWGKVYRVCVIFFLSLCHCVDFSMADLKERRVCVKFCFLSGENSSRNCHNASRVLLKKMLEPGKGLRMVFSVQTW